MFGFPSTYNRTIRKMTVAFGSLFTNLVMVRYNYSTGTQVEVQRSLVPCVEGQKEKYIQALQGDPLNDNKISVKLPIISYSLKNLTYDSTRKQQTTLQNVNGFSSQYVPVPYNFNFEVVLYVRNIEDGTQILEQILPYFTPSYNLKLNLVSSMNIQDSIPFVLNSTTYEVDNESEASSTESRVVMWTLNFTGKGFIYGPINNAAGIIKEAIINFYDWNQLSGSNVYLVLGGGFGNYIPNETIYQGNTLETATATAIVSDWTSQTKRLLITNVQGNFYNNTELVGAISGVRYNLLNYEIEPQILETIDITANTYVALGDQLIFGGSQLGLDLVSANSGDSLIYNINKIEYNTTN